MPGDRSKRPIPGAMDVGTLQLKIGACMSSPGSVWRQTAFLLALLSRSALPSPASVEDVDRLMNLAKAHLENRESAKAVEVLAELLKADPTSTAALRNLARAHLIARRYEAAVEALAQAEKMEPNSPATAYLKGLALLRLSRFDQAIGPLETAVRGDPNTGALRYQLACAYEGVGGDEKAGQQFHETLRLDPLHAGAYFKLSAQARKANQPEEAQKYQNEFVRLRRLLGEAARSAEAFEQCGHTRPEGAAIPARRGDRGATKAALEVRFEDATEAVFPAGVARGAATAAVVEVDAEGGCAIFAADGDGGLSVLRLTGLVAGAPGSDEKAAGGVFERKVMESPGAPGLKDRVRAFAADYHDDVPPGVRYDAKLHALTDVLLVGSERLYLLKQTAPGVFSDVTGQSGLPEGGANAARWLDYEHDGDVDLMLAGHDGLQLWQNNGDGRFENATERVGIQPTGPAVDAAIGDLDGNEAVDFVVARGKAPTLVYLNQRAGRLALMSEPPGPWPPASRAIINDFDNDGLLDTVLLGRKEATLRFGGAGETIRMDLGSLDATAVAPIDHDNDGWLDLCFAGGFETPAESRGAGIRLFRNPGFHASPPPEWRDVSEPTKLADLNLPPIRDAIAADIDGDGDSDLLLTDAGDRLHFLRNAGAHANGQLKIRLLTVKTNPTGIGTHIELRKNDFRIVRQVNELPIEIGVGGRKTLDSLQTIWTNGVVDNQIDATVGNAPQTVIEKNVATGSCPFLYAWDGKRFRFVTDVLGNSPLGLSLRRDVMLPADPDELALIGPADGFPPQDGAYTVAVTSEFCEVLYLDFVRLLAVDHPADVEVHSTDKIMPPPFAPSEVWALGNPRRLIRAEGSDGQDRTEALRAADGVFAPPGLALPPPFRGMCHHLSLTLDFGPLDTDRPLVLALTGWLQYGQASTNIALSQSSRVEVIPPVLEVEAADGAWVPLDVTVGIPAGKTKTILCDLSGKLPSGARRLRLTNTFEIRWDRAALFERRTLSPEWVIELPLAAADLRWRGFSEIKSRAEGHPTTPDHDVVFANPPWRGTLEGWCTRYGDVLELVAARDGRLAIVNGGDSMTLRFADPGVPGRTPPSPPFARGEASPPKGFVRTFFFYSVGWDKDADANVVDGNTVEPLPSEGPPGPADFEADPADWRLRYNTRWVPRDRFHPSE